MSPAAGKRARRWHPGGRSQRHAIEYTPRPHITLDIRGFKFNALIDSGSEISFVNARTVELSEEMGIKPHGKEGRVQLADGASAYIPGALRLPIRWNQRTIYHTFAILPTLHDDILIGVDLYSR